MDSDDRPVPVPRKSKQRVTAAEDTKAPSPVLGSLSPSVKDHQPDEDRDTKTNVSSLEIIASDSCVHGGSLTESDDSSVLSWSSSVHKGEKNQNSLPCLVLGSPIPLVPLQANVCFVGWLRTRRPRSKATSSIWGVLKENVLHFYRDDSCDRLLDSLPCANVLLVSKLSADAGSQLALHYVHPRHRKVKCRYLSTDNDEDLSAWITLVGKSFFNEEMSELDGILDAVGKAYIKQGSTTAWTMASLAMRGSSLFYSTNSSDCIYELDFRKVYSIKSSSEKQECCSLCKEKGSCFAIMMGNSTLWLQADSKLLTSSWKMTFESVLKRRSNLLSEQRLSADDVPIIVEKCVNFISIHGLKTEGIHRLSGTTSKVDELYTAFISDPFGVHLLPEQHSVHTVASVLRKFFAQLAEPLIPYNVSLRLLNCNSDERSTEGTVESYKSALRQLPRVNHATLRKLIKHLREVTLYSEISKMNVQNVACIFAPTMFRFSQDGAVVNNEQVGFESGVRMFKVVADLILHYDDVFDISAEESYRESQVHRALSRLSTSGIAPMKLNSGFLHCLHVFEKDKISFNIKIGVDLSAEKVCEYVKSRQIPSLPSCLALYEVICDGQLERIVASNESVFDILMRWISWPQKDRVGNYLVVKEDIWTHRAAECAERSTAQSRWLNAYVSLAKSFVKHSLILMPNEIMLFKNQKEETAEQVWRISDHLWFVGAEAKRHPPAKFNVTFVRNCEFLIRSKTFPFLGVALSFKQEADQLRLLTRVLQTPAVYLTC